MIISQKLGDVIEQIELGRVTVKSIAAALRLKQSDIEQTAIGSRLRQLQAKHLVKIHKTHSNRGCWYTYIGTGYEVEQKKPAQELAYITLMNELKPRGEFPRPARLAMWGAV